jgi:hypothetical protein
MSLCSPPLPHLWATIRGISFPVTSVLSSTTCHVQAADAVQQRSNTISSILKRKRLIKRDVPEIKRDGTVVRFDTYVRQRWSGANVWTGAKLALAPSPHKVLRRERHHRGSWASLQVAHAVIQDYWPLVRSEIVDSHK